jgi:two-component system capsular synthesis sensor histidine kinase RcsC
VGSHNLVLTTPLKSLPFSWILCADNDPLTLASLKVALEFYGFNVIPASDGIAALAEFRAHETDIDAVVVGNELKPGGGAELVRALREKGFQGRIVVMFEKLGVDGLYDYQDLAISGLFHKPFPPSLLAEMLLAN